MIIAEIYDLFHTNVKAGGEEERCAGLRSCEDYPKKPVNQRRPHEIACPCLGGCERRSDRPIPEAVRGGERVFLLLLLMMVCVWRESYAGKSPELFSLVVLVDLEKMSYNRKL
jgi:hypothetical protein